MPSIPGFQSTGLQVLSAAIYLLGISAVSHCLSRRVAVEDWSSFAAIREVKWARLCIILILVDSWLFLFSSALLMFGVGLELSPLVCAASIYLCVAFYATSKVLLYLFLVEKVHIVWNPHGADSPRMKSRVFILGMVTVSMYLVVIGLMVVGRNHYFREDGTCIIGLKHYASVTLLAYDLYINLFLTSLFLYPLIKTSLKNPRVTRVAIRTLIASAVSLTTSSVNMTVLTVLKGHELGWICLGAGCGVDVIVNACALFWATRGINASIPGPQSGGTTLTAPMSPMSPTAKDKRRRMTVVVHPFGAGEEHELNQTPSRRTFGPISQVNDDRSVKYDWDSSPPSTHEEPLPSSPKNRRTSFMTKVFGDGQKHITSGGRTTSPVEITVTTHQESDRPSTANSALPM